MKPKLFEYVEAEIVGFDRHTYRGLVTNLLSMQFSISMEESSRLVLYSENWGHTTMGKKLDTKTEAPSVWRNHQSRTCILLEWSDDANCDYIPLGVDEPFHIVTTSQVDFLGRYLEPIDYPVGRAASLYAEYARDIGAEDSAIEMLSKLTDLTNEEMEIAKAKAKRDQKEAPTKKKAAEKEASTDAPKPKKKSGMGKRMKELILTKGKDGRSKFTDDEIFATMQEEHNLADNRRGYVNWYRYDLKRKGQEPPEPKEQ